MYIWEACGGTRSAIACIYMNEVRRYIALLEWSRRDDSSSARRDVGFGRSGPLGFSCLLRYVTFLCEFRA